DVKTRMLEWQPDGNGIEIAQSKDVVLYKNVLYRGNAGILLTSAASPGASGPAVPGAEASGSKTPGPGAPVFDVSGPDASTSNEQGPLTQRIVAADNHVFRAHAGMVIGSRTDGGIADVA